MVKSLEGFDKFQLRVRNSFRPVPTLNATTRAWIIEMDRKDHEKHYGKFLEIFHGENDITIVPSQGVNTWDPDLKYKSKYINKQNKYLTQTTILTVGTLAKINEEFIIGADFTTLGKKLKLKQMQLQLILLLTLVKLIVIKSIS